MTILFLLSIICWCSSFALYVILRIDLFKTIFLVSNLIMTFLGAWVSGYYFRKYEHSIKAGDDHSLDALEYAKKVCDNEEQENRDFASQIANAHFIVFRGGRENGKSNIMFPTPIGCEPTQTSKKCVNCKHFRFIINHTIHSDKPHKIPMCYVKEFDSSKIYRFNNCEYFEEK